MAFFEPCRDLMSQKKKKNHMLGSYRGAVPKKSARLLQPSQERTCGHESGAHLEISVRRACLYHEILMASKVRLAEMLQL